MTSSRLLARFRDGARDHLARADALLMRLEQDPRAVAASSELLRLLHTLKGETRAMGLGDAADHAHQAEANLVAWTRQSGAGDAESLDDLRRALAAIESIVEHHVGALRLHHSGARALPARELSPSLDLGEVELGPASDNAAGPRSSVEPQIPEMAETVRVPLDKLEALSDISGDLFLGQAHAEGRRQRLDDLVALAQRQQRLAQTLRRALGARRDRRAGGAALAAGAGGEVGEAADELLELARALRQSLGEAVRAEREDMRRARLAALELAERVRDLRLVPIATLFDDCPRLVRDLAESLGREARLVISGVMVDVDRHVVEELRDPILHLVQNAIDHGIEPPSEREAAGKPRVGTVEARVAIEGEHVILEVADDGRGIDPAALRAAAVARGLLDATRAAALDDERAVDLIFLPEFSSRAEVSPISGRGVGLDVVRDRVAHLHGHVSVKTLPGKGTCFTLRIPGMPARAPAPADTDRAALDQSRKDAQSSRPERT